MQPHWRARPFAATHTSRTALAGANSPITEIRFKDGSACTIGIAGPDRQLHHHKSLTIPVSAVAVNRGQVSNPCVYASTMISQPGEVRIDPSPQALEVVQIRVGHRIVLAVSGELDIATAPTLQVSLDEAVESRPAEIWIDLSNVSFMDSTGLRALLNARRRLHVNLTSLAIICPEGPVRRVFTIAGLDHEFSIHADRASAHAAG
jgi:anti-sigma B factor antagonist